MNTWCDSTTIEDVTMTPHHTSGAMRCPFSILVIKSDKILVIPCTFWISIWTCNKLDPEQIYVITTLHFYLVLSSFSSKIRVVWMEDSKCPMIQQKLLFDVIRNFILFFKTHSRLFSTFSHNPFLVSYKHHEYNPKSEQQNDESDSLQS